MTNTAFNKLQHLPHLGLGIGLRHVHFDYVLEHWPACDWFEIISENFIDSGGKPRFVLDRVAERYPIVMHGVSMSIGSSDPLNFDYLGKLKKLAAAINPAWISDHLCWTGVLGVNTHDLLPVLYTEETLQHISERIRVVQDFLERPLVLENPSTYMSFTQSTIAEADFLRMLTEETGCGLLLDVNNVFVTCFNNDLDPIAYIEKIPADKVVQFHLAGHQHCGTHIIDTHDHPVVPSVWELFRFAWQRTGGASVLLEWDNYIPGFEDYHAEVLKAKEYMTGEIKRELIGRGPVTARESFSTPIGFLVPDAVHDFQNHSLNDEF